MGVVLFRCGGREAPASRGRLLFWFIAIHRNTGRLTWALGPLANMYCSPIQSIRAGSRYLPRLCTDAWGSYEAAQHIAFGDIESFCEVFLRFIGLAGEDQVTEFLVVEQFLGNDVFVFFQVCDG